MDKRSENFKIITGDRIADKLQLQKNVKREENFEAFSPVLTRQNSKKKSPGKIADLNTLSRKVAIESQKVLLEENDTVNIGEKIEGLKDSKNIVTDSQS